MKKKLKTITLSDSCHNPTWSLCPGHVTSREFNAAFKAEGWKGGGRIPKSELKYQWWRPGKRSWKIVKEGAKGAKPFTGSSW
jgi:hypothetical protein